MEAPICKSCLSSSELCESCHSRVREMGLTEVTLSFFREVRKLAKKDRGLRRIKLLDAAMEDNLLAVTVPRGHGGVLIGKHGRVAKKLERKVGKKLRVLEVPHDYYDIAISLLKPARVLGINKLFLPNGKEKYRIRVQKWDMIKLPSDINSLENLLTKFMGKEATLYFE